MQTFSLVLDDASLLWVVVCLYLIFVLPNFIRPIIFLLLCVCGSRCLRTANREHAHESFPLCLRIFVPPALVFHRYAAATCTNGQLHNEPQYPSGRTGTEMERRRRRRAHRFSWQTRNPPANYVSRATTPLPVTIPTIGSLKARKRAGPSFAILSSGPFYTKFFDTWLRYVSWQGHRSEVIHELHFKYGPHAHLAFQCFHRRPRGVCHRLCTRQRRAQVQLVRRGRGLGIHLASAQGCRGLCRRLCQRYGVLFKLRWPSKKYGTFFLCPIYFPVRVTNSLYIVHRLLLTGIRPKSPRARWARARTQHGPECRNIRSRPLEGTGRPGRQLTRDLRRGVKPPLIFLTLLHHI
ncbi:hypothetical protein B0H14DRAFT_89758 [Mycena olivaceomarginata]|nr:hypothetical protein B0H14DRAFT_115510 [Mycena olivaceomarginata]KAJ7874748.1 hypothetical protein B0H14DRAFT_89758 [Mycena olivaceomarginata]